MCTHPQLTLRQISAKARNPVHASFSIDGHACSVIELDLPSDDGFASAGVPVPKWVAGLQSSTPASELRTRLLFQ